MTSTDTYKELTDNEQLLAGRAMLSAALEALGKFPDNMDDEDQDELARRVVRAMAATAEIYAAEQKRLSKEKGGYVYLNTGTHEAVATAFWMWSEEISLKVSEVHPSSVAGSRLLAFAQAMMACRQMSETLDMLNDGSYFAFNDNGAKFLVQKLEEI